MMITPGTVPKSSADEACSLNNPVNNGVEKTNQSQDWHRESYQQRETSYQENVTASTNAKGWKHSQHNKILLSNVIDSRNPKSKSKHDSKELPPLLGPFNRDLFRPIRTNNQNAVLNHEIQQQSYEWSNGSSGFENKIPPSGDTSRTSPIFRDDVHNITYPNLNSSQGSTKPALDLSVTVSNQSGFKKVEQSASGQLQTTTAATPLAEDIVETVMPMEGNQTKLKLYEAPPWMKRAAHNSGRRTPSAPATGSSETRTPIVVMERSTGPRTSLTVDGTSASHFRRVGSLPHTSTKRISSSVSSKSGTSGFREYNTIMRKAESNSPPPRSMSRESGPKNPVQIVRTAKHGDEQMIEIVRDYGTESRSSVLSNPRPPRSLRNTDSRTRVRTSNSGDMYSNHLEQHHSMSISSAKYNDMNTQPLSSHYSRHSTLSESGASPLLERGSLRSSLRTPRPLRSTRSTPASPVMGQSTNRIMSSTSGTLRSAAWSGETRNVGLPPLSQTRGRVANSIRTGPGLDNLTPTGPPTEQIITRVDPVTGLVQRVTTRTQSFSDIAKNVFVTETDENIEDDQATEYHIRRHTIRKHRPSTPKVPKSASRIDKAVEPIQTTQIYHANSMDENASQWQPHLSQTVDARPYRAVSQTNISGRQPMARNQWISESNLRTTTTYKQPPMYTNYSAHRENMRKMEEQSRTAEDWMSNRHLEEAKSATGTEVLEEMETITLQPIGRGVHDLEPTGSIARSFRANTPTGTFYSPPSAQISRPHSSAAYMYPYTPGPSRQVRSDISHLANARSEVNMVASQPLLTGTTNRNRVESMSSEVASYSTKRFNQSRTSERYVGAYNSHSARPSPAPLSTSGRIQSPSFFSHQRKSRSATPARDLISPLSDGRIAYRESPITSRYASLAFTSGPDQSDGYRTIATTNLHREVHTSGAPSPYAGAHHSAFYDSSSRGMDSRYRTVTNQSETQWRGVESGSVSGVSGHADMVDSNQGLLRQVKDTFMNWYLPEKTREEVNTLLRDKEPGSFIIRNSISCVNSFSLGLKIPPNSPHVQTRPDDFKTGFVRHFIIGTVPMNDGRGDGLQLCGFVNQPVFPSLVDFVHHHILQPGPFPCPLRLPVPMGQGSVVPIQQGRTTYATQTSVSGVASSAGMVGSPPGGGGDGIAADMLYLGQVEVDRLENAVAVRQAITQLLSQAANNPAGLPKRCEVLIKAIPNDGITFVDKTKRTMLRKHIKPSQLLWCGIDPENRTFPDPELRARGMPSAKTFGIVARRQHFFMHENVVYVFSELDPTQSAINLCHYINGVFHTH